MRVELSIQEAEELVKTGQEKGISNEAKMQQGNRTAVLLRPSVYLGR